MGRMGKTLDEHRPAIWENMTGLFRHGERSFKVIFSLMPLKIM